MQREGDLVEIPLEEDAGGIDEVLVVGRVRDRLGVEVGGDADGTEIGKDDGVRLREQTGGARRGFRIQDGGGDQHGKDQQKEWQPEAGALGHVRGIRRGERAMP